ncbi:MAG: signal peptidase I [Fibrobacter sp.]|nr:signal peptidase I [Fibrobacter sp.]
MDQTPKKFSIKNFLKSFAREIIVPVVLALVVIQYVIQAFQIPSGSMEDSLHTGDFLLGLKFTYGSPIPFSNQHFPGYAEPKPGDVVIFRYPGEPEYPDNNPARYTHLFNALMFGNFYWDHEPEEGQPHLVHYADGPKDYIKRCVAVSGDTVAVHKGKLSINGVEQDTIPGRGKWTEKFRSMSPRDEREAFVVPSVGDTFVVDSLPLEKLWWVRSIILQENPDSHVELEIALLKDGVEDNNYEFEDFKVPVENDRGMLLNAMFTRNRTVIQHRLTQGDTVSGSMPFSYFRELARIGFLPLIDPHAKGGLTRQVSYIGFEGSLLRDLEGNVAMLNAPTVIVADSAVQDSSVAVQDSVVAEPSVNPHFEIRRRILVDGSPIETYVVKTPQFFMMGDNRDNSADSRYWGFVTLRNIRAKASVIYFSFENDDQAFSFGNPFSWWRIPFRIRWSRIGKVIPLIER